MDKKTTFDLPHFPMSLSTGDTSQPFLERNMMITYDVSHFPEKNPSNSSLKSLWGRASNPGSVAKSEKPWSGEEVGCRRQGNKFSLFFF